MLKQFRLQKSSQSLVSIIFIGRIAAFMVVSYVLVNKDITHVSMNELENDSFEFKSLSPKVLVAWQVRTENPVAHLKTSNSSEISLSV